ncbi:uncharacterized protein PG986_010482 [Apiospora aurea]|uniref:Uncharacterized protein n=1 Tax=Apiospora aurea TaxID=335848 RepID=A0ABR1Q2E5_9PEZI
MGITFKNKALRYLNKESQTRRANYAGGFETKYGHSHYLQKMGLGLPPLERNELGISFRDGGAPPKKSTTAAAAAASSSTTLSIRAAEKKSNNNNKPLPSPSASSTSTSISSSSGPTSKANNNLARRDARMSQHIELQKQRNIILKKPNPKTKVNSSSTSTSTTILPARRLPSPPASAKSDSFSSSTEEEDKSGSGSEAESLSSLFGDNSGAEDNDNDSDSDKENDDDDDECIEARPRGRRFPIPRVSGMYIHGGLYDGGYYDANTNSFKSTPQPFPARENTQKGDLEAEAGEAAGADGTQAGPGAQAAWARMGLSLGTYLL